MPCKNVLFAVSPLPQPVPCQAAASLSEAAFSSAAAREPCRCAPGVLTESPAIFPDFKMVPGGGSNLEEPPRLSRGQQVGEAALRTAGNLVPSALRSGSAWPDSWRGLILQEEICVPLKLTEMILAVFFLSK